MTVCSQVAGVPCPPAAANSAAETTVRHQTLFMVQPSSVRMVSTRSMPGMTGHDGTGVDIQRQQRCGDQIVLLLVAGLGAGVQHHGQQRTDGQHDSGDREQEGRLANGHSLRPPSQQPERDDEDGEQENVAGQFKDRAQRCTPKA